MHFYLGLFLTIPVSLALYIGKGILSGNSKLALEAVDINLESVFG